MPEPVLAPRACRIALIEDNPADVRLLEVACEENGIKIDIELFSDGESALRFVQGRPDVLPDLLIVDINIPRIPGTTVIQAARQNPRLAGLPIIVWTTSQSPDDLRDAEQSGATCVIPKPNDYDEFSGTVVGLVNRYCFKDSCEAA